MVEPENSDWRFVRCSRCGENYRSEESELCLQCLETMEHFRLRSEKKLESKPKLQQNEEEKRGLNGC